MWLLENKVLEVMREARENGLAPPPDASEVSAAESVYRTAGSTAEIDISGVLTKTPDIFARWFGGGNTTYPEIQAAIREATSDPSVKSVSLRIDSPGGSVDGYFETIDAVQALRATGKPVTVRASKATSAAYGIAAAAGKIQAASIGSEFGSVGVAQDWLTSDRLVSITNEASPAKRPDVKTEEGRKMVVEDLNAVYSLFARGIAEGRGVTVEELNESFGRGATLLAGDAKKRGMIDSIARPPLQVVRKTAKAGGQPETEDRMDLGTLKREHPEVYAAARAEGAQYERERVNAHIRLGKSCGDVDLSLEAIESGQELDQGAQSKYLEAAIRRNAREARQEASDEAGKALDGIGPVKNAEDKLGEEVARRVEEACGISDKESGQ